MTRTTRDQRAEMRQSLDACAHLQMKIKAGHPPLELALRAFNMLEALLDDADRAEYLAVKVDHLNKRIDQIERDRNPL